MSMQYMNRVVLQVDRSAAHWGSVNDADATMKVPIFGRLAVCRVINFETADVNTLTGGKMQIRVRPGGAASAAAQAVGEVIDSTGTVVSADGGSVDAGFSAMVKPGDLIEFRANDAFAADRSNITLVAEIENLGPNQVQYA